MTFSAILSKKISNYWGVFKRHLNTYRKCHIQVIKAIQERESAKLKSQQIFSDFFFFFLSEGRLATLTERSRHILSEFRYIKKRGISPCSSDKKCPKCDYTAGRNASV